MAETSPSDGMQLPAGESFSRADLVFSGVDHGGPSYQVAVHLTGLDPAGKAVGAADAAPYYVFGHGGCFGDEGHCEIREPVSEFDYRPPHQLIAATRVVTATDEVKRLIGSGAVALKVSLTPIVKPSPFATAESSADLVPATDVELRFYRS